jgi:hypothetical protein
METTMFEQVLDSFRRASESSLQTQQEMFKQWTQQWLSAPLAMPVVASGDGAKNAQKRWLELTLEVLNKHRATLDATYSSGIQVIEQMFRVTEAKSPEDSRRLVEEIWRKLFDTLKGQSETQLRDFQKWAEQSFELAQKAQG